MKGSNETAPIIIKRKKVVAGAGHHGGAWKVAYADFVTAMMAFFLLMWLLNATTEKQRKGIADYFNPTVPVSRVSGGGDGVFGGDSVFSDKALTKTGTGSAGHQSPGEGTGQDGRPRDNSEFSPVRAEIDRTLSGFTGESMVSRQLARRVVTRLTDEGLIVEFFDLEDDPLFASDSDEPMPVLHDIAAMLARVFALVPNEVAVNGHVRSYPQVLRDDPVWPLSERRAERMRGLLSESGFDKARVQRVSGYADRKPAVRPALAARNNRIEVILLRQDQR